MIVTPSILNAVVGAGLGAYAWFGQNTHLKKLDALNDVIADIRRNIEHFNMLIAAASRVLNAPDVDEAEKRGITTAVRLYKATIAACEERLRVLDIELKSLQAEFESEGKKIDDTLDALKKRKKALDEREAALNARLAVLSDVSRGLDERQAELVEREAALTAALLGSK